ncbi:uncharacterized protein LOC127840601 [Dreissena polymorpha]|uniref:uncharacterized protein LOC127840601 n=1 Tax=Dreissena polymorpha TaxID=45954 RepID=UPI0022642D8D|nr:uncharacterized protein LOC127840601 [Dreissena polymorpha]
MQMNFHYKRRSQNKCRNQACVIVNSCDKKLQFKGGCALQISAAGGKPLEDECRIKYPDGIKPGFVAFTGAHELAKHGIRFIFHIALDKYKGNIKMIKDAVISCLKLAVELKCFTIAFPALGVGTLEYPWRETAFVMFETVEEFSKINPGGSVKDVKFICHTNDTRTYSAFENEAFRRSENGKHKLGHPINTAALFQCLIGKNGGTEIRVLKSPGYCAFPAYAVEVRENAGQTKLKTNCSKSNALNQIKEARHQPCSWNDILLGPVDLQQVFYTIMSERITHLIWNLDNSSMENIGKQIETIVRSMDAMCDRFSNNCLRTIDIVVDGDRANSHRDILTINPGICTLEVIAETKEKLSRVQERVTKRIHELREEKLVRFLKSFEMLSLPDTDTTTDSFDAQIPSSGSINGYQQPITPSKTVATDASTIYDKTDSLNLVPNIPNNTQLITEGIADPTKQLHSDSSLLDTNCATYTHSGTEISKHIHMIEVSAEINSGIVRFLAGSLSSWIQDMYSIFSVEIKHHDGDCATVYGSLDAISKFEEYLSTKFPRGPDELDFKENHFGDTTKVRKVVSQYQYEFICKFDIKHPGKYTYEHGHVEVNVKEQEVTDLHSWIDTIVTEVLPFDNETDANFALDKLKMTEQLLSFKKFDTKIIITGILSNVKTAFASFLNKKSLSISFERAALRIDLQLDHDDILQTKSDFVVVSSTPKMHMSKGAARLIHDMLNFDEAFRTRCEESIKENKEVRVGECRVIESGLGIRKWIGHVYVAKSTSHADMLHHIETSIKNSLREAELKNCQTIAFTCIGSDLGHDGLTIHQCVNCYVSAITSFTPKHNMKIIFVENNKPRFEDMCAAFRLTIPHGTPV